VLLALVGACAVLLAAGTATGAAPSLRSRCVKAGVAPLPRLSGRAFIDSRGGFSNPRLLIRWRSRRLPAGCEGRFRRSVAVEVRLQVSNAPVAIPLGKAGGGVDWLTFVRGFKEESLRRARAEGLIFAGSLGCIETVNGLVRYRVTDANGRLLRQRFSGYQPRFHRCRQGHPSILPSQ
jgi:hypothetical protein